MFLNVSSLTIVSAVTNVGSLDVCMTKMGYVAAHVSGLATSLFGSQAFIVLQTSIDYGILPKLFLYGMFFGAAVTIFCRIFGVEENPIYTRPLLYNGGEILKDILNNSSQMPLSS